MFGAGTIQDYQRSTKSTNDLPDQFVLFELLRGYSYLLGVEMLTSIFCVPPPPNIRPLNMYNPTNTISTKITTIATTPTLPLPPPSSAMQDSPCLKLD
jgi:hypothetical protein